MRYSVKYDNSLSAGAHLAFLQYGNTVAVLREDDDVCILIQSFTFDVFSVR